MEPSPDIDGMKRVAAGLRDRATALDAAAARLDRQVAGMVFAGPAADQFRTSMLDRRQRLARAAAELQSAADTVTRAAVAAELEAGSAHGYRSF